MANENQIKQKIVLEGEKEYSSAIKEAQRNLRTLRSELKAETAELGRNASAQQQAQVKAQNLRKQISEQEKVVKSCRAALEEVRQKYGDNAEMMAKYETRLNNARATLATMRGELEDVSDAFDDSATAANASMVETHSFAESLESISDAAGGIATAIEGLFSGMVNTVKSAVSEVWGQVTELAGRANAWIDLAGYWNTSATEIQKWYHAVRGTYNNFEDLNNAVTRIVMGDQKKIAEATGVSSAAYEDQWQYAMAVMDALSHMDYDDRVNAMGEVFGERRATKVMDLVNDWEKIVALREKFSADEGGLGMTQEQMDDMATIAEQVAEIEETWKAFKDSFMAGAFGKLTLDLAGNAQGMLDALIDFMGAESEEEREQALKDLETNMTAFFTRLGEAIEAAAATLDKVGGEMAGSENGTVAAIGNVLQTISNMLGWFADKNNIDKVVDGFEKLAGVWAGAKMLSAVGTLASLAAHLTTIRQGGGLIGALFGGGKAATAAGAGASAGAEIAETVAGGVGLGAMLKTGLLKIGGAIATKVAPWLAGLAVLGKNAIKHQGNDDLVDENGQLTATARKNGQYLGPDGDVHAVSDMGFSGKWDSTGRAIETPSDGGLTLTDAQRTAAEAFWDAYRENPMDFSDEAWDAFESAFAGQEELFDTLNRRIDELTQGNYWKDWQSQEDIPTEIFAGMEGIGKSSSSLDNAAGTLKGLPGQILAAVRAGVSNIRVTIDGYTAGGLIAPYVSERIARDINYVV